ncbi:hypothetical protein [Actinomadura sp. KC216]|nr:hypothetical protein [Actinomadura sp. KC216]
MASLADAPGQLIALRAAMGLGSTLVFPVTLSILVNVCTDPSSKSGR